METEGELETVTMMDMPKKGLPAQPESTGAEIRERAKRAVAKPETQPQRQYTPAYKQRILRELDEARASGERGAAAALLRREGLTRAHVYHWEKARDRGDKAALTPARRGRPRTKNPLAETVARLERENERLKANLLKAETVIDVQKKLSALLGIAMPATPEGDETP